MKQLFSVIIFALIIGHSEAQREYFSSDGIAIRGYDPVAYFKESTPVMGSKDFSYTWQGVQWNFKDTGNLGLFKANPEKYAPQFGGYCAYGVSENHKSPTEPAAFTIVDDKLYLNYSLKVKEIWVKDTRGRIEKGKTYWASLDQTPSRTNQFNLEEGLAIQGYDPVAYFTSNKAIKGEENISHKHEGVVYYFSSAANKDAFVKNPVKYEPQYGGWCAYAMGASGEKVEIDPETFKIVDSKLYLFYNSLFNNTLPKWNKEEADLKSKADRNWKSINK